MIILKFLTLIFSSVALLWLIITDIIPRIWDKLFGTHQVIRMDVGRGTIYETRRNLNNELIKSDYMPDVYGALLKLNPYCGYTWKN